MRVLITGHTGFIGRNLHAYLKGEGFEVAGIDVASPRADEQVDIRDADALGRVFARVRPEAVVHLAALASVPLCEKRPEYAHEVNADGTRAVARLCAKHGAWLVFMSSAAVYGNPALLPTPTTAPQRPVNVYGETKVLGERHIREELGADAVIFRLFNAYGERCERSYVIPDVIRKALSGLNPIPMQGLGSEAPDFVYIRDVLTAIRQAVEGDVSGTYNLGTGHSTDIRTVAGLVIRELGLSQVGLRFEDESRVGDFRVSWADVSDGNTLPGWAPAWALPDGVRNTVSHYVSRVRLSRTPENPWLAIGEHPPRATPSVYGHAFTPVTRDQPPLVPLRAPARRPVERPVESP